MDKLLVITSISSEMHNRNTGSANPFDMRHRAIIKGTIHSEGFRVVEDDDGTDHGQVGTLELALRKALMENGIKEEEIPKLEEFSVPGVRTCLEGAASEIQVVMKFKSAGGASHEFKGQGKDVVSLAFALMVEAYNDLMK